MLHVLVVILQETDCLTYSEHCLPIGHSKVLPRQNTTLHIPPDLHDEKLPQLTILGPALPETPFEGTIFLSRESKGFGICLLRECDWKDAFGQGDRINLETVETREKNWKVSNGETFSRKTERKACIISSVWQIGWTCHLETCCRNLHESFNFPWKAFLC